IGSKTVISYPAPVVSRVKRFWGIFMGTAVSLTGKLPERIVGSAAPVAELEHEALRNHVDSRAKAAKFGNRSASLSRSGVSSEEPQNSSNTTITTGERRRGSLRANWAGKFDNAIFVSNTAGK